MKERQAVTAVTATRYRDAKKREKGAILDEFIATTGYSRWYARFVLRHQGRRIQVSPQKTLVADVRESLPRTRRPVYDQQVLVALVKIWRIMDYICSKRLRAVLGEMAELLERRGELKCEVETKKKLAQMSAATIDRLLRPERRKYELRGRAHTRPGTLLKHQIPIRTFAQWDEQRPGFVEIDLVAHDGGVAAGDYCQTLDLTDIATGWTETAAVQNKAQVWVFEALKNLRENLPFPLLGIDSDNGGEFINAPLKQYCDDQKITFTRSRPYRKNDNCFVEQKNYSVVRRAVGYARYDTGEQLQLLNELYGHLRLYTNCFMPTMKLLSKERNGSKVKKRYDAPQTPYQRVLASSQVSDPQKERLRAIYEPLNPAALKRKIDRLQQRLTKTASRATRAPARGKKLSSGAKSNPRSVTAKP